MAALNLRTQARLKRKKRIRKNLVGTTNRPRLCVFRSAKHIYAQLIDDSQGQTLVAASSMEKAVREGRFRTRYNAVIIALNRNGERVERKIGEVAHHGIRDTRYVGTRKRQFQRLWTGTAVNLKRLFVLADAREVDLHAAFVTLGPPTTDRLPA